MDTDVNGVKVKAGERVSLCWASANQDERVFESPQEVRLDRKPNPHISFGFGTHLCLGAPHARLILRTLLQKVRAILVSRIEVVSAEPALEHEAEYDRTLGYESLVVRLHASGRCAVGVGGSESGRKRSLGGVGLVP